MSCSSNHDPRVLATVTGQTSVDPTLMQLMLTFASCCLVSIIKNSVHPTPNITDTVSHGLDDKICIRRSIRAEWYIQLCTVRVEVDLWEVTFNDLKQVSRLDIEKQGPKHEPWRTPCFKGNWLERLPFTETRWNRSDRYHLNQASALSVIPKSDSRRQSAYHDGK